MYLLWLLCYSNSILCLLLLLSFSAPHLNSWILLDHVSEFKIILVCLIHGLQFILSETSRLVCFGTRSLKREGLIHRKVEILKRRWVMRARQTIKGGSRQKQEVKDSKDFKWSPWSYSRCLWSIKKPNPHFYHFVFWFLYLNTATLLYWNCHRLWKREAAFTFYTSANICKLNFIKFFNMSEGVISTKFFF